MLLVAWATSNAAQIVTVITEDETETEIGMRTETGEEADEAGTLPHLGRLVPKLAMRPVYAYRISDGTKPRATPLVAAVGGAGQAMRDGTHLHPVLVVMAHRMVRRG